MWWELVIVSIAVGASILYLARAALRTLAGKRSCASACGGCPKPAAPGDDGRPKTLLGAPLDFRRGFPSDGRA